MPRNELESVVSVVWLSVHIYRMPAAKTLSWPIRGP